MLSIYVMCNYVEMSLNENHMVIIYKFLYVESKERYCTSSKMLQIKMTNR